MDRIAAGRFPAEAQGLTFEARLQGADLAWPMGIGEVAVDLMGDGGVWLEILAVDAEAVFRVIDQLDDTPACEVLRARCCAAGAA